MYAVECERESCNRALLQGFSKLASLLLALNESTIEGIRACVRSENPPSAYTKDPEDFQEVVDAALKEHNQTLTRYFLESAQSGNYRPFATIGSFGAHNLSTFQELERTVNSAARGLHITRPERFCTRRPLLL